MLDQSFFNVPAVQLAQKLLGCELVHATPPGLTAGIIVETEAYNQDDEASHSFGGISPRNKVMFGPAGHAYVYFSYGVHYCFNVVAAQEGRAEAVLIRALQPTHGIELMKLRRHQTNVYNLCSGPAKLVQALGLGPEVGGASVATPQLHIVPRTQQPIIYQGPRIGITKAAAKPWRFFEAGSPYITKHPFNKLGVVSSND